jgi:signal transduction histidine kinase
MRSYRLLIAAALFVPTVLFVAAAWQSRADALREGEAEIVRSIAELRDNTKLVLDAEKRTLASVDDHILGMTWEDIAKPGTSVFLRTLASSMDGIASIRIADPDGYVRAASEPLGLGGRVPEHEFFAINHPDDAGIYMSTVIEGAPPRIVSIDMVRSLWTPSGAFNGTIHAALNAAYFVHLYQIAAPIADDVVLVRGDGEVFASDPKITNYHLNPDNPLMRHIAAQSPGQIHVDRGKLQSYLQVPDFPVYVSLGVNKSTILRRWYYGLMVYGAAAFAASLALLSVSWMAIQRAKSERKALSQLNSEVEKHLETERRLHVAQRMEAVGQLTAGIAHDFNNLLAVILGNLDLLTTTTDHERTQQLVARARRAGVRGSHLISSLLTFAGRQMLQVQTVNLNALLGDFLPLIRQSVGEATRVEVALDPALLDCRADPGQLEAALLNLAVNARDAMPKGGILTISTRNIQLAEPDLADNTESVAKSWIAIAFRDTGGGMTDEVKARIFEPFFTTKGVGEGSGLGLSQLYGFVQQVGGRVTVDSKPGHGTTVTLYLPPAESAPVAPPP